MRLFRLVREQDLTGVSGIGEVAEGVEFSDGTVAMRWKVPVGAGSTAFFRSIHDVKAVHGHGGATMVMFTREVL